MEKDVAVLGIEDDLKDVKDAIENHGERIVRLETDNEVGKEKFNSITSQLNRIEANIIANNNVLLSSNASMLQTMNKLIEGNTIKSSNKKEIIIKTLTIGGSIIVVLILGYFAARGISVSLPLF